MSKTIKSTGNITVQAGDGTLGTKTITLDSKSASITGTLITEGITIDGNKIGTNDSNANVDIVPNGTGKLNVRSDAIITGTLETSGFSVTGALSVKNGATSAGFIEFFEDSDNGTNKVTVIGPASTSDATLTLPGSTDTLVGRETTDILQNKTLTTPTLTTPTANNGILLKNGATSAGFVKFFEDSDNGTNGVTLIGPASTADVTVTLPASADTLVGRDTTDTLTNKTLTNPTINGFSGTGNASVTGVLTSSGNIFGVQTLTGPGTINVTTTVTLLVTTGTDAYSLPNGTEGQLKIISMKTNGGNGTVTPDNFINGTSILFNNVEDTVIMLYQSTGWVLIARQNATVS